ncbi:MAG: glycosyltransferase, partial [Solirubrobacteraceae bacterium]
MSEQPLLTAALIVRDEERVLGDCLRSLRAVADEIVIVDTGSSDATIEIARAGGARVLQLPWSGDFSAPRNLGLEHARGRWILYVDADERVWPPARDRLQRRLRDAPEISLRVLLTPFAHATPYFEYRLWRNDPRIRFQGVMHERVADSIHLVAAQDGRPIADWPELAIEHVGYDGDQTAKHRRNLPLLEEQLRREPGNIFNWRHLSRVLHALGRDADAIRALERAVKLARAQDPPSHEGSLAWAEAARLRHEHGLEVRMLLAEGRERWPEQWLLRWIEGQVDLDLGRPQAAAACFGELLAVDVAGLPSAGIAYDGRIFGEWAHASLGLAMFRSGRFEDAAAAYAAAERCNP